ncbi:MAG: dTDP-4-dehydrorhamnose reductase [Candidatus Latescibacteria bacterium]|nr:dTDP-4-dehydrorhamnose reductase [Candidatus Latescibacterota bacterium]
MGMKLLVTGAHGLLGRSLLEPDFDAEMIGCGRGETPVGKGAYHPVELTDPRAVLALLEKVRPDWVIHTAALTDVDRCESDRPLALQINLDIVRHLASACRQLNLGLVQLSTDYVFDGQNGPYSEQDPTNPLSYYGAIKLQSEGVVLQEGLKGLVLRTLWLYGYLPETRRNLVTWPLEALARGDQLKMVDDQWGNPTHVHDLAQVLVELCRRQVQGLFHLGGATYLTRYQLTQELARFFGLDSGLVQPISTATAGQKAPRPLRSGLRTQALESLLGHTPLSLSQGLERLADQENFRRDFPNLF